MRCSHFFAAFIGMASLLAAQTPTSQITFVSTGDLHFGTMDLVSGNFTRTGPDMVYQLGGIGVGADGNLYGLDAGNSLVRIDPGSGVVTSIGYSGIPLLSFQPDGAVMAPEGFVYDPVRYPSGSSA